MRARPATPNITPRPRLGVAAAALGAVTAALKAAVVAYRSAGAFANALPTAWSTKAGRSGRVVRSGGTTSHACRAKISRAVVPRNGGWPASISYKTQPNE